MVVTTIVAWAHVKVYDSYAMELLVVLLGFGVFLLIRRKEAAQAGRPPHGLFDWLSPAGPARPGVAAPASAPRCESDQWKVPPQRAVPPEVTARAVQILTSPAPLGHEQVEYVAGRPWKFVVEMHGPNEQNPNLHRGVGVRQCV